jgi:hypothetical protein
VDDAVRDGFHVVRVLERLDRLRLVAVDEMQL